ncbi:MAG: PTPA-CTERM sorting domain-containing protein [Leptolyngbyaceae cyanobacterium SM2_3_12]|nr:PTPA-CTERM sorting domain-containing protein [Leptolyngbyaceae cyanobacterium SM2_3_12]
MLPGVVGMGIAVLRRKRDQDPDVRGLGHWCLGRLVK